MKNEMDISLFIPCIVDQVYPEIGIAMAKVLKYLGCRVSYYDQQTCCGQPAFNAGYRIEARKVAKHFIESFRHAQTIVGPSGSCIAMVKKYYHDLFDDNKWQREVPLIGGKIFEFSQFISQYKLTDRILGSFPGKVGFHNSCHSLQELGITTEPLEILSRIADLEVVVPSRSTCCGFGGLFSIKFENIGSTMAKTRLEMFATLNLDTIITNDPGCLMHLRQEIKDLKLDFKIYHLTEFIAKAMDLI